MNKKITTTIFLIGFLAILSLMTVVWADSDDPFGVRNINQISSSRPNVSAYPPANISAEAGNVTELNLTAIATTKSWQGYYGEIFGTLTLENSDGYVFYNWTTLEPKGEIYASINNTINWTGIRCWQFNGTNSSFDVDTAEGWYGIEDDDEDGINETFTTTNIEFYVGTVQIAAGACHATNPYQDNGSGQGPVDGNFENILLTDSDVLVFTTIIENNEVDNNTDIVGFDGVTHDFQLLVAENGQDGNEDTYTTYYFWAEIE